MEGLAFPKTKRVKRKRTELESNVQDKCECLLDRLGMKYVHIPGSLQMYLRTKAPAWVAAEASRAFKGIPDLLIFKQSGDITECLLLELKTEIGVVSQSQRNWAKGLDLKVAYGYEEAEKIILEFAK